MYSETSGLFSILWRDTDVYAHAWHSFRNVAIWINDVIILIAKSFVVVGSCWKILRNDKRCASVHWKATQHKLIRWFTPCKQLHPSGNLLGNRCRIFPRDAHWLAGHSRHNHRFRLDNIVGNPAGSAVLCYILHTPCLHSSVCLRQVETSLQNQCGRFDEPNWDGFRWPTHMAGPKFEWERNGVYEQRKCGRLEYRHGWYNEHRWRVRRNIV